MYGDGFTCRSTRYTSNGSTGSVEVEALREHHLEDVAGEDVLLRRLDRRGPRAELDRCVANVGQLGRARRPAAATGRYGSGRAELVDRVVEPAHRARRTPRRASSSSAPGGGNTFSIR